MPTLVFVYDGLAHAEQAREALARDGFAPSDVALDPADDEAGPAAGNFLIGNGREDAADPYRANFSTNADRTCVMTVRASDDAQAERAEAVAARFGGRLAG